MDNYHGSSNIKLGKFSNDGMNSVTNIGLQDLMVYAPYNPIYAQQMAQMAHARRAAGKKIDNEGGHRDISLD